MGRSFDLVIFDCDGVLVDSEPIANRIWAEIVTALGHPMTVAEAIATFAGRTRADNLAIIADLVRSPLPADLDEQYQARLYAALREELVLVEGIEAALDRIDLPMCVASSAGHVKLRLSLELTGLLRRFEGRLFSAVDVPRGKPHPDLFLHAAAQMGALPARCVVVEDSIPGVEAGIAAGMRVLGYGAAMDAEALANAGAKVFFDMGDLPELLAP